MIYAWNAGNLDGASGTYEGADSEKTRAQYPNGYASLAKAAGAIGTKFGAWCGPDGLGSTEEESRERYELMVSLCRDYHFGLFKMDGVCGDLRPEKQELFVSMMKECRKYSPELILLNHRLNLGEGMPYATTSLWNGQETYVDVFISNHCPAPHNRAYIFDRGNTPGLERLIEDHGVCLSSCLDYFEDDLIYQAFGRSLILAPEIYGNPWFLRDDEQAKLARIYNLHRAYGKILVSGVLLPPNYGPSAVSRGDGKTRFITTGNKSWSRESISVNLNSEIGLERNDGKIVVAIHHPYERVVGVYSYGDRVAVDIPPFRACLIEVSYQETFRQMLSGCEYEVLHETEGRADRVKLLHVYDTVRLTENGDDGIAIPEAQRNGKFDNTIADPIKLGTTYECEIPSNAEQLLETAHFVMDMDSFEARSLKRSGDTKIPEVKAARDAFFNQETYILRGCESKYAFDGKNDTFFDGLSKTDGSRADGGCLRVDFGSVYNADYLAIEYFDVYEPIRECVKQEITPRGDFSTDLAMFKDSYLYSLETVCNDEVGVLAERVHNIIKCKGRRCRACY